jgi:hypothetical protein
VGLLQELADLLQVTGLGCSLGLNQDLANGLLFFHGFRLEERRERVKEKNKIILRECGKVRIHWGKRGKTEEGKGEQGDVERFTTTL